MFLALSMESCLNDCGSDYRDLTYGSVGVSLRLRHVATVSIRRRVRLIIQIGWSPSCRIFRYLAEGLPDDASCRQNDGKPGCYLTDQYTTVERCLMGRGNFRAVPVLEMARCRYRDRPRT